MITEATVTEIERVVNMRQILPALGLSQDQRVDMSNFYGNAHNVALRCKVGMMLFGHVGDGAFECHFLFLPGATGKDILKYARIMLRQMFTKYGACVIRGYPPRENRAVRVIGLSLGFTKINTDFFTDSLGRVCETYELRGLAWVR